MSAPRLLEKIIVWMLLLGFVILCIGYVYMVLFIFHRFNTPLQIGLTLLGAVLILLSLLGTMIFRRLFVC